MICLSCPPFGIGGAIGVGLIFLFIFPASLYLFGNSFREIFTLFSFAFFIVFISGAISASIHNNSTIRTCISTATKKANEDLLKILSCFNFQKDYIKLKINTTLL